MFKPVLSGMTLAITALAAFQPTHAFAQSSSASPISGAASAPVTVAQANAPGATAATAEPTQTVEVTTRIKRLNDARTGIQTQTGASIYTLDSAAINAMPGGDNVQLNQVLLQAPEVAQDSFGQFHVRGEHNGLQYRINGLILPEGISVFGQSLDPRVIESVTLVTGALPAEYGLRTAGIIDVKTKTDAIEPGGSIAIYGGSHGTVQPSISYAGGSGDIHYFLSADSLSSGLGIESPDGSSTPLHDHTHQHHAFGYVEDVLDPGNRIAVGAGTSVGSFQIPNQRGLQPSLGLDVNGQTAYASDDLNENQREITHFGFLSYQHSVGPLDWQTSVTGRYSSLNFTPDPIGDLLYNGIAQDAYKRNTAVALQSDAAYKLNASHTIRGGVFVQRDLSLSRTTSQVLPTDDAGNPGTAPESIVDNGSKVELMESVYLQDEWLLQPGLTVNYGARFDNLDAYTSGHQLSPRLNVVWNATRSIIVHGGYSRYFSPPPFELVGNEDIAKFANTTAAPEVAQADTPKAERANYFDFGVDQTIAAGFTVGLDTYYKRSKGLIDEGQFGAPIILTPFNYAHGKQYGAELKLNYVHRDFSVYGNVAFQSARGQDINSAQFNFGADDLAYIANHYIHLDHEQRITGSAGASYLLQGTRLSADAIVGSGLRSDETLADGSSIPNGAHLPTYTQVNLAASHKFQLGSAGEVTLRLDVVNAFDRVYEIRNGTGVGVGAPQFGPRRGFFFGVSKSL
jgi:outer membrane receptor protein involved in Fe transport